MFATKNFLVHVKNTDQNFADRNFRYIGLKSKKMPELLFPFSCIAETLHVTSS